MCFIWATSWKNLILPYANNKGADQPAHPRSLISAVVFRCLDNIIPLVSVSEISSLYLASLAAQPGLCLTWSQTTKTRFLVTRPIWSRSLLSVGCLKLIMQQTYEPPHDKTNKMTVRPAKTQISLDIRQVWSDSLLCAQWIAKDPSFLHADSEDSDQTGRMHSLGAQSFCWFCHVVAHITVLAHQTWFTIPYRK